MACLKDEIEDLNATKAPQVTFTFDYQAKCYNENVRQCCYDLLLSNVSIGIASSVICSVAKNMFGCDLDRFPSTSLLADMAVEMKQLAQMRAAEAVHIDPTTTWHTDGTTKHGRKCTGYQETTSEASVSLGTLDKMKELFGDAN